MARDSRWRWGRGRMARCRAGCHATPVTIWACFVDTGTRSPPQSRGVRKDSGLENAPNVICSFDGPTPESSLKARITRVEIRGVGKVRGREDRHSGTLVAKKRGGHLPRPKDDGRGLISAPKHMPRPQLLQAGYSEWQQRDQRTAQISHGGDGNGYSCNYWSCSHLQAPEQIHIGPR